MLFLFKDLFVIGISATTLDDMDIVYVMYMFVSYSVSFQPMIVFPDSYPP